VAAGDVLGAPAAIVLATVNAAEHVFDTARFDQARAGKTVAVDIFDAAADQGA